MHTRWTSLGGSPSLVSDTEEPGQRLLAVAANQDGRLEVFALGIDGGIWHLWQAAPGGRWVAPEHWTPRGVPAGVMFGGPTPERRIGPAIGRNADGRLEIFALGDDGAVWQAWQTAPNAGWITSDFWATRGHPAGVELTDLVVASNADGRLEIFALGDDGAVWQHWQTAPGSDWLAPGEWASRGAPEGVELTGLAVGRNADGRLEIFATGDDGALYHQWQLTPDGGWPAAGRWTTRGAPGDVTLSRPAVARNADGRLEVFAVGSDAAIWHVWQTTANGDWTPVGAWTSRGAPKDAKQILGSPVIGPNQDGRLELFVWSGTGTIQTTFQTTAGGTWLDAGTWHPFEGDAPRPACEPVVAANLDGRLEAFVVDAMVGDVSHAWQRTPNGNWT